MVDVVLTECKSHVGVQPCREREKNTYKYLNLPLCNEHRPIQNISLKNRKISNLLP